MRIIIPIPATVRRIRFYPRPVPPTCPICNEPVELETSKTDEHGRAIHEECYLLKILPRTAGKPKTA